MDALRNKENARRKETYGRKCHRLVPLSSSKERLPLFKHWPTENGNMKFSAAFFFLFRFKNILKNFLNYFFLFLNYFNVLISKIIFKN